MKRRTSILGLSLALGLMGCQHDPWAEGFLTVQPAENDVVGTYVIDANSQKRTIKVPQKNSAFYIDHSAQVVLLSDHKAAFFRVPEEYRGEAVCSVTGRGSWRLGKNDNFSVVRASIINEEPNSPCKGDFAYDLMLYGDKAPYKLHITIGDPDSGDAVQFEKQH